MIDRETEKRIDMETETGREKWILKMEIEKRIQMETERGDGERQTERLENIQRERD